MTNNASASKNQEGRASNGLSKFFKRLHYKIARLAIPSGLNVEELKEFLGLDFDLLLTESLSKAFVGEITKRAKETANTLIASNFKELTTETLSALIIVNAKLDDTQKARICEILSTQVGKDLSYLR